MRGSISVRSPLVGRIGSGVRVSAGFHKNFLPGSVYGSKIAGYHLGGFVGGLTCHPLDHTQSGPAAGETVTSASLYTYIPALLKCRSGGHWAIYGRILISTDFTHPSDYSDDGKLSATRRSVSQRLSLLLLLLHALSIILYPQPYLSARRRPEIR